jgi:hypothetical protein
MNVFESDPHTTDKICRSALKVDVVGMSALLGSAFKVECLKGYGIAFVELPQDLKNPRMTGQFAHRLAGPPRVLQAPAPGISRRGFGVLTAKRLNDALTQGPVCKRFFQYKKAFIPELPCHFLHFWGFSLDEGLKKWGIKPGQRHGCSVNFESCHGRLKYP